MPRISALVAKVRAAYNDQIPINSVDDASTKRITIDMITPTGSLVDYAGATPPQGWLLCYGQTLNATSNPEYAALYNVIGTLYGGTGITAFNLPDLRGRVVAGPDAMGGTAANRLTTTGLGVAAVRGAIGGRQSTNHAYMESALNNNAFQDMGSNYISSVAGDINTFLQAGGSSAINEVAWVRGAGGTVGTNGTQGTEVRHAEYTTVNVQPTIILNKIIKY